MATELTGPFNCAECGTGITMETMLAGDAGPLVFTIEEHAVEVPGLYVCTPCAGAIMVGEKQSTVTKEAAVTFLAEEYLPRALAYMQSGRGEVNLEESVARMSEAAQVGEILMMADLMERMEQAAEEEGVDREDMAVLIVVEDEPHPRDKAAMN